MDVRVRRRDQKGESHLREMESMRSLLLLRWPSRSVGLGLCRKFLKTRLFSRSPSPSRLRSNACTIFLVQRNSMLWAPSKNGPSILSVSRSSLLASSIASSGFPRVKGEGLMLLRSSRRLKVGEEDSILSSKMFARELLCFSRFTIVLACFSCLACLRKRSPRDLVDLTDLLSLEPTLRVSLQLATVAPLSCRGRSLAFLPRCKSSMPPPISWKRSQGDFLGSVSSVPLLLEQFLRSEPPRVGLPIQMEGNLGVERAEQGSSESFRPNENWKPSLLFLRILTRIQSQLLHRLHPRPSKPTLLSSTAALFKIQ